MSSHKQVTLSSDYTDCMGNDAFGESSLKGSINDFYRILYYDRVYEERVRFALNYNFVLT